MDKQESEFLEAIAEGRAFMRGENVHGARVHYPRSMPDLKGLRARLAMSQEEFSRSFGIPLPTLRGWEIGRYAPDATATAYLNVIAEIPDPVRVALTAAPAPV